MNWTPTVYSIVLFIKFNNVKITVQFAATSSLNNFSKCEMCDIYWVGFYEYV